mgnify:CR=1 FL=1
MGLLVEGVWHDKWYDTSKTGGRFERSRSQFRDFVTRDGAPAEGRERGFRAEPGRYHLYVSLACPWAHRTLIFRKLKKLEDVISVSVVHHFMGENGSNFGHIICKGKQAARDIKIATGQSKSIYSWRI